jgi:hypothetical protein
LSVPVLFLIFNRPALTAAVFEQISKQKPAKLYIAADGPRGDKEGEDEKCEDTKNIVLNGIDWNCEVKTLFRTENLGCGSAVSKAIDWFFLHEEYGIILEDDCVPGESFFNFCKELLIKYKTESRIMMISGCSFQKRSYDSNSYYYSRYIHIWGWATWRRAWEYYQFKPADNAVQINSELTEIFGEAKEREVWVRNVLNAASGAVNTWDYQWMYAIWKNNGFSVVPWRNLISNIGYGDDATHTIGFDINTMSLPVHTLNVIKHPREIGNNKRADKFIRHSRIIGKPALFPFLKKVIKKLIK